MSVVVAAMCVAVLARADGTNDVKAVTQPPFITLDSFFRYNGIINQNRPDMRGVAGLTAKRKYKQASEALLEHFKTRKTPLWINVEQPSPPLTGAQRNAAGVLRENWRKADDNAKGKIVLDGDSIEALVVRYHAEGDKADAELMLEIMDWLHENALPPPNGDAGGPRKGMESFYRCEWLMQRYGFLSQFQLLVRNNHLDEDHMRKLLSLIIAQARSLMLNGGGRNGAVNHAFALVQAGIFLPEISESYWWRREGMGRAAGELYTVFYPDGGQVEHSTGYDAVSLKWATQFLGFTEWVARNMNPAPGFGDNWERSTEAGLPLPRDYQWKLRQAVRFYGLTALPNGVACPLGDGSGESVQHRIGLVIETARRWPDEAEMQLSLREDMTPELAARRYPDDPDLQWVSTQGRKGAPPRWTSAAYPYMGYFVMRSGWDSDARYCLLDSGAMGGWHGHDDKLSVILFGYGRTHLRESSTYGGWVGSQHNTLMVDGNPIHRRHGPDTMDQQMVWRPYAYNRWTTSNEFDYAVGCYDDGWARPEAPGQPWPEPARLAIWKRAVFFAKPDVFFVTDFVSARDGKGHKGATLFHLSAEGVETNGNAIFTHNKATSRQSGSPIKEPPSTLAAYVVGARAEDIAIVYNAEAAPAAVGVEKFEQRVTIEPYPTLVVRGQIEEKQSARGYVFVPIQVNGTNPVASVREVAVESKGGQAIGVEVVFVDKRRWVFAQSDSTGSPQAQMELTVEGAHYSADAVLLKYDAAGQPELPLAVRGKPLEGVDIYAPEAEIESWLDRYRCYPH